MNYVFGMRFTNTRLLISRSSCYEPTAAENSMVGEKDDLVTSVEQFLAANFNGYESNINTIQT